MNKSKIRLGIKFLVSAVLIAFLIWTVDWRESFSVICRISLPYVVLLLMISFFMITISCIKWKLFLRTRNFHISLTRLIMLYLIGYFFNNFLPTSVGGDIARSLVLGSHIRSNQDAFGSVFLERFTGSLALLVLAQCAFFVNVRLVQLPEIGFFLILITLASSAIILLLFSIRTQAFFSKIFTRWLPKAFKTKIESVLEVVYFFRTQPVVLTKAMAISFLFHIMTIINTWVVCLALDISSIAILDLSVIVPIILLISMAPISINAIGVWEGAFVFFFSAIGVPPSNALSIALVLRAKTLLFAIFGGFLFALWGRLPKLSVT